MRRRVTRRLTRLQTMYNVLKYWKKWWNNDKNQFTVTGVQPHRNRKYFQFNNAHDCNEIRTSGEIAPTTRVLVCIYGSNVRSSLPRSASTFNINLSHMLGKGERLLHFIHNHMHCRSRDFNTNNANTRIHFSFPVISLLSYTIQWYKSKHDNTKITQYVVLHSMSLRHSFSKVFHR